MKCPHCVDGVVHLFSSTSQCEHCDGSGTEASKTLKTTNTLKLRYVAGAFTEPKLLLGAIDGVVFKNENELLGFLGPLDDLHISDNTTKGANRFFIDLVTMRQGRCSRHQVSGRGCSFAMEEALLNCLFVQTAWYTRARENANIFLDCLLRHHEGDWSQGKAGETRRSHTALFEKNVRIEQVDRHLEELAETLLITKSIVRGQCSVTDTPYELPHELSYTAQKDGFEVRVTTMFTEKAIPKIEVSFFT